MALTCKCPADTALPTIAKVTCAESLGQIQKVAFQRLYNDQGSLNGITEDSVVQVASWTALFTANDSTKIVMSPFLQAPTSEGGAARTFGGGNETLGGIEQIVGREPTSFSAVMRSIPQDVIAKLKEMQCEAEAGNLGVYLFDENGHLESQYVAGTSSANSYYRPIPIRSLFIGDKTHGGLEAPDSNAISWSFLPNYSDNIKIKSLGFNPLNY